MRCTQPIRAGDGKSSRLGIHSRGEREELLEIWAHSQIGNVTKGVQDSEGCTGILHDLVREKPRESGVVCTASGIGFTCARKPFEEKDQGSKRLERCKLGCIEGVKVIYNKRYTE